jgi:hypothetical protein
VLVIGCVALLSVTVYSSRLIANPVQSRQEDEEIFVIDPSRMSSRSGLLSPEASTADSHFRRGGLPHRPIVSAD